MEKEQNEKKDTVDWKGFLDRKRINKSEVARLLGAAPAMMTEWGKGKSDPSRKYLKKLCEIGMTAQEMFGKEAGDKLVKNSVPDGISQDVYNSPQFQAGVAKAIEELKAKGKI